MNNVAVYYNDIVVYWDSILIVAGVIACFFIGLAFYKIDNKYGFGYCIFAFLSAVLSVLFSRIVSWYCNMEAYDGFAGALEDFNVGGYLVPGILIAVWFSAVIVSLFPTIKDRFSLLDPMAPGLAFAIAIIKFSSYFSDHLRGKIIVTNEHFQGLPISVEMADPLGEIQYRFATFFISFLLMLLVTGVMVWFFIYDKKIKKKAPMKESGHIFRFFLVSYGMVEVVMDSTRYDAAHLFFPGKALAVLNKGAGFMGLSQFLGALFCLYAFIYYLVMSKKIHGWDKTKHILPIVLFVLGLSIAGVSEYLVQRYSGMYLIYYATMTLGVLSMGASIIILFLGNITSKKPHKLIEIPCP